MGLAARPLLVDTQTAYWIAFNADELGRQARRLIESASLPRVSVLSIFELQDKQAKGRLPEVDITEGFQSAGFVVEPLILDDIHHVDRFSLISSHDPFDRLIQGQAARLNANFLTSDRKLLAQGFDWIIDSFL